MTVDQQYTKPLDAKRGPHHINERSSACGGFRYMASVQTTAEAEASAPRSAIPILTADFGMSLTGRIKGKMQYDKSGEA